MRLAALALAALCLSCTGQKAAPKGETARFTIYYNNDNMGYLESCGCRVTPIGGMHRRWNAFQKTPENERLFVDAGNTFFKSKEAPEYLAPQWREQALGVVEAYNLLKADAVTPGESDFALGLNGLKELQKKAQFPFISSNIFLKNSQKPLLDASIVTERNGTKIGIIGLYSRAFALPPELEARDPLGFAKQEVARLRGQGAEFIVVLSHMGLSADQNLARAVSGIQLIVGAHSQSLLQTPELIGQTHIVQLSNQGQMLGKMEYEKSADGKISLVDGAVEELGTDFDGRANAPNPMPALIAITKIKIDEANSKLEKNLWDQHPAQPGSGFQTFLNCRGCHEKQAHFQEGHLHAAAMLTLVARKQSANLDCVKCHSVGLGAEGGFSQISQALWKQDAQPVALDTVLAKADLKNLDGVHYRENPARIRPDVSRWIAALKELNVSKAFVGVQCENCHGPRPEHPFGNDKSPTKVLTGRCLQCHTQEQMPAWYDAKGKVKPAALKKAVAEITCPR